MPTLAEAVVLVAGQLSGVHARAVIAACEKASWYSAVAAASVTDVLPAPHKPIVAPLLNAWKQSNDVPGRAIALALEASLLQSGAHSGTSVEVVVSGPSTPAAPVRLTSEVVTKLINDARERVTLISFAFYGVKAVVDALDGAAARGVRVQLVAESPQFLDGGGGVGAYGAHAIYEWPPNDRQPPTAKLHAKALVVDSTDVLLTSANMTNAGQSDNLELGLLCRGGHTARSIQQHFDALIATGVLKPMASGAIAQSASAGDVGVGLLDDVLDPAVIPLAQAAIDAGWTDLEVGRSAGDAQDTPIEVAWPALRVGVLPSGVEAPTGIGDWDLRPPTGWTAQELTTVLEERLA